MKKILKFITFVILIPKYWKYLAYYIYSDPKMIEINKKEIMESLKLSYINYKPQLSLNKRKEIIDKLIKK
jgi:hypothetical protein